MGTSGGDGGKGADGWDSRGGGDVGEAVEGDCPRQASEPSDAKRISLAPLCDIRGVRLKMLLQARFVE